MPEQLTIGRGEGRVKKLPTLSVRNPRVELGSTGQPRPLSPHADALEQELHRRLQEPRRVGVHDLSEAGAADVAIHRGGSEKLRVIENVEGFQSKLKRLSFSNDELFCYRHIEVV